MLNGRGRFTFIGVGLIDIAESHSPGILKARELLILALMKPVHHKHVGFNTLLHSTE